MLMMAYLLAEQRVAIEATNVIALGVQHHNFRETVELQADCAE
jgi:hypothetical protein